MEPSSLFDLCLSAGCSADPNTYQHLPPLLKDKLLLKLSKRGLCTDESLVRLIHPSLVKLDLRECCIDQESILCIEKLSQLAGLYLPQPPLVTPDAYSEAALVKVVKGKHHLLSLGLSGLHGVTDRVVSVLVGSSPKLVELHLQETLISDRALYCLASLSSLQCLNIARTEINDSGVMQLASGSAGQSLLELRLDGCYHLTNNAIKILTQFMSRLHILYFHLCPNMSDEESSLLLDELNRKRLKNLTWTVY